jgi:hypothetical protein
MAMSPQNRKPLAARVLLGLCLLVAAAGVGAQNAGEVEFARGVGFAQTPGQTPRTLGKGLELREGDRLTTADGSSAIIKLQDGTRMTVRPNSELVISQYHFKENAPDNSMLMQLVRGGFRAVTGLISKGSPSAARVQTSTATIGIRGTDFDARLCTKECGQESQQLAAAVARPNSIQASAKIVTAQGEVYAVDTGGTRRRVVEGGSVYPGDVVETMPGTRAVLAFRDDTRVTLGSNSKFRVDNFVYDETNANEGRFLATLLRGSVRALTGLIAKANTRNANFATPTATIGIRGTGFDAACGGTECSEVTLWAWLGSIAVTPNGKTALELLQSGQGLFISPQGIQPVFNAPPEDGPRPDTVNVPPKLFGSQQVDDAQEGLFVFVRDGHIEIATANDILQLGKGEAGFAGANGNTARPDHIPKFIDFDKLPLPTSKNPLLVNVLADAGIKQQNQCK